MPRSLDEQHTMVQHAIDTTREASELTGTAEQRHDASRAAVRNQEVQSLTLIALELRELRMALERLPDAIRHGAG